MTEQQWRGVQEVAAGDHVAVRSARVDGVIVPAVLKPGEADDSQFVPVLDRGEADGVIVLKVDTGNPGGADIVEVPAATEVLVHPDAEAGDAPLDIEEALRVGRELAEVNAVITEVVGSYSGAGRRGEATDSRLFAALSARRDGLRERLVELG